KAKSRSRSARSWRWWARCTSWRPAQQSRQVLSHWRTLPIRVRGCGNWLRTVLRAALIFVVVSGALVAGREAFAYAATAPGFVAKSLIFEPTPHVSDDDLRKLLGIAPGTTIWSIDLEDVRTRVRSHPW